MGIWPFSTHAGITMGGGGRGSGSDRRPIGAVQGEGGGGSNGGMRGNPLAVFTGNQSKADKFLKDFKVYQMANQGNQTIRIPLKRVTLILTYNKGKNG